MKREGGLLGEGGGGGGFETEEEGGLSGSRVGTERGHFSSQAKKVSHLNSRSATCKAAGRLSILESIRGYL